MCDMKYIYMNPTSFCSTNKNDTSISNHSILRVFYALLVKHKHQALETRWEGAHTLRYE